MTTPLGSYSFLPWLRRGLANHISAPEPATVTVRPQIQVQLLIQGSKVGGGDASTTVSRSVALLGPGDILGIDHRAVVRVEPRHWSTNFEPNYLPHIEFYAEDFPWRYTPAAPGNGRLRPWITLVVLTEDEFTEGKNIKDKPLPYIDVTEPEALPLPAELWAWAHVHVNRDLAANAGEFVSTDEEAVLGRLAAALGENPDLGYSRLLCPRKLAPNTGYHAFLIPTYETGRRAGLGEDLGTIPATRSAWGVDVPGEPKAPLQFPVYYRWFFRTAASGDFETLVRLLQPRPVDSRVGIREMDVQFPGAGVPGVDKAGLGGVLRLGGALRPPLKVPPDPDIFETWDSPFPRPLQTKLAQLINLPDDLQRANHPDPIITPPLYGCWHALTRRVLTKPDGTPAKHLDNWVHRLNLDPRFRVPAGFGTRVIQDQQEKFMQAAWEQLGTVLEAQLRIRRAQFSVNVSMIWYDQYLLPSLNEGSQRTLQLLAPLNKRLITNGVTVHQTLTGSLVQPAMTSAALRRMTRPRGRLIRSLPFAPEQPPGVLLNRVNAGEVSAAPPKTPPPGVPTFDTVIDALPKDPQFSILADTLQETNLSPDWVRRLPKVDNFIVRELPGRGADIPPPHIDDDPSDSPEGTRLKEALIDEYILLEESTTAGEPIVKIPLDPDVLATEELDALRPDVTIPKRVKTTVLLPPRIVQEVGEGLVEPMAYPVIDLPMYEPLKAISTELFLPNVNLVEPNAITLLETNQRFIESYLVGLNHEFARELLWREYPTDQRGSTFRQFWDVRSVRNVTNLDPEVLKEKLRDIPPLHKWTLDSPLGDHDNRQQGGQSADELVLVIRGELLKRYPNAVIYAHRARWQTKNGGVIDPTRERQLEEITTDPPPPDKVRTPRYEAKIDPDIYFLGFDLTVKDAKGGTGQPGDTDPGWFFVIKQRPGEPRFGLDNDQQPTITVWNDLAWPNMQTTPGGYLRAIPGTAIGRDQQHPPAQGDETHDQYVEDDKVAKAWDQSMNAAKAAYILFQPPVLIGIHASEMLRFAP